MKLSKYFMMAAASLALFACSNDEDIPGLNGEGTKSVALKLDGLSSGTSTKAVGDAQKAGQIALSNVTIYFTDGTKILKREVLNSESPAWTELTGKNGHIFHQLPSTVTQVQIVGNSAGKTITEGTVAALKGSVLKAAGEQEFTNVTLFGEDAELTKTTADEHGDNVYTATVDLKPLVARFEIGNIACTDMGTGPVSGFDLKVIGLMDFNTGVTLDGTTVSGPMTLSNILEPGSKNSEKGKYIFGEESDDAADNSYADVKWAWDKFEGATNINNTTPWNPETNKRFVYQFIPNKLANGKMAQIKLVLDNVVWTDGSGNPFNSVVTAKFQKGGQDLTEFEAGKIYTVDYQFKGENVGPWNPDDVKCVKINVTVASWEIVALTPVFE